VDSSGGSEEKGKIVGEEKIGVMLIKAHTRQEIERRLD
jgi:hypothetical protein